MKGTGTSDARPTPTRRCRSRPVDRVCGRPDAWPATARRGCRTRLHPAGGRSTLINGRQRLGQEHAVPRVAGICRSRGQDGCRRATACCFCRRSPTSPSAPARAVTNGRGLQGADAEIVRLERRSSDISPRPTNAHWTNPVGRRAARVAAAPNLYSNLTGVSRGNGLARRGMKLDLRRPKHLPGRPCAIPSPVAAKWHDRPIERRRRKARRAVCGGAGLKRTRRSLYSGPRAPRPDHAVWTAASGSLMSHDAGCARSKGVADAIATSIPRPTMPVSAVLISLEHRARHAKGDVLAQKRTPIAASA